MADSTQKTQIVKLHHLRPAPGAKTAKTRVGRGEGSKGKTAGRGTKGTKARYQVPVGFEGGQMPIHMRLPKLRGFKNPFRVEYQVVNVGKLGELFPEGGKVTVEVVEGAGVNDSRCIKIQQFPENGRCGVGIKQKLTGLEPDQMYRMYAKVKYSDIPQDEGRGAILWWGAARTWEFEDGVCKSYTYGEHTAETLIMAFRVLEEEAV